MGKIDSLNLIRKYFFNDQPHLGLEARRVRTLFSIALLFD